MVLARIAQKCVRLSKCSMGFWWKLVAVLVCKHGGYSTACVLWTCVVSGVVSAVPD